MAAAAAQEISHWCFFEHHRWIPFNNDASNALEKHYQKDSLGICDLTLPHNRSTIYRVDFSKMEQMNCTTGFTRPVQRMTAVSPVCKRELIVQKTHAPERTRHHRVPRPSPLTRPSAHQGVPYSARTRRNKGEVVIRCSAKDVSDEWFFTDHAASVPVAPLVEEKENCALCCCEFEKEDNVLKLVKCGHHFHADCGMAQTIGKFMSKSKKCPVCGHFYGSLHGNQPAGKMRIVEGQGMLPGFEDCGVIQIDFNFPGGVQAASHPKPGHRYSPDQRVAYFPNNKEGRKVVELFKIAFKRRLLFTIGYSQTRKSDGVIIYNGIHMKTRRGGGPTAHGYPDNTYLTRVKEELALKGVTETDLMPQ